MNGDERSVEGDERSVGPEVGEEGREVRASEVNFRSRPNLAGGQVAEDPRSSVPASGKEDRVDGRIVHELEISRRALLVAAGEEPVAAAQVRRFHDPVVLHLAAHVAALDA